MRDRILKSQYVLAAVLVAFACLRVCFAGVLWSDEDYHMAAAIHILHGKIPYRDFWYDKPPLTALYYLVTGGYPGLVLRLWDACYILLCCFLAYKVARDWWGEAEGWVAALLLGWCTTFYLPAAVIPFAPDALLLAPHLAAVYFARRGKAWAAGVLCGVGFWINVKALFIAASCAVWLLPSLLALTGGFGVVVALGAAVLASFGMAGRYWDQVWVWGLAYASGTPVSHPLFLAAGRIGNWVGFHAALAGSWVLSVWHQDRGDRVKCVAWLGFSFVAVCLGNHFAPRYFLQLLPPLVVVGARGVLLALENRPRLATVTLALLLLVPLARFGPRYVLMARQAPWGDIRLNSDSQQAAAILNSLARPGDTLFVWGYRPDMYVYTRLSPASRFWDSQPLTGVAADRHLSALAPVATEINAARLRSVEEAQPEFFVDGLGLLNDKLKPENFVEMRELLRGYRVAGRTSLSIIYQRQHKPTS